MTIEQKKIALINWISNLEDEKLINRIEKFRKTSLSQLPGEIVQLLQVSDAEGTENLIEHTTSRGILNSK